MKLNFKDLKQQKFTLDAEPTDTVVDVKKKVADEKGFEAGSIRLIWSGKILQDDKTIDSYDIQPNDQIVCMVQKPKAAPVTTKAAPATPAPVAPSTPSAPPPAPAQSSTSAAANAPATPSPAPATATAATTEQPERPAADPNMMMGAERQAAIANMESMGFERAQIERAMRAAFYHPDRAVEYLLNGIPENLQPQERAPTAPPATSPPAPAATTGSRAAAAPAPAEAEPAAADEPVNLFEAAAAAYQGGRGAGGAGRGAATGIAGGGGGGIPAAGETANLDFLRNNEAFQQMRQAVQQNPPMLEQLLQQVAASNPALASMINSNPAQFIQLLSEGQPDDNAQNVVSVTEEERDAIERLCRLGFERDLVIQAYFACDKNEELAANFLFDQPDDDQPGDS